MANLRYYNNLDGLRGIAAMMVIVFHYFSYPISRQIENINLFQRFTEFGQHGVSLFFVLSGFVITRILFSKKSDKNYFRNFYIRRILRIFPLYYTALIVFYYLFPILFSSEFIDIKKQLVFFFYLQNITPYLGFNGTGLPHLWSLAVEEHFYILWPLLIYIFSKKRFLILLSVSILTVFVIKAIMLDHGLSINKFTFTRIDQIIMGGFLAYLEIKGKLTNKKNFIYLILFGLLFGILVYYVQGYYPLAKEMSKYFLLGIFFTGLIGILISLSDEHFINRFLRSKPMQFLGKISYGLYVWHIIIILMQQNTYVANIWPIDLSITIIGTIALSYISFTYLEQPFIKLKDKYTRTDSIKSDVDIVHG